MRVTVPFVEVYYRIGGVRASAAPVKMYVDRRLRTVRLDGLDEKNGAERWINAPTLLYSTLLQDMGHTHD
jgi:hypothetical protein